MLKFCSTILCVNNNFLEASPLVLCELLDKVFLTQFRVQETPRACFCILGKWDNINILMCLCLVEWFYHKSCQKKKKKVMQCYVSEHKVFQGNAIVLQVKANILQLNTKFLWRMQYFCERMYFAFLKRNTSVRECKCFVSKRIEIPFFLPFHFFHLTNSIQ